MTAEERDKMNALCLQIQQEKDYEKFEDLTRQLNDLVARKERRFPERKFLISKPNGTAWKLMPARATKILESKYQSDEIVEISLRPRTSSAKSASKIPSSTTPERRRSFGCAQDKLLRREEWGCRRARRSFAVRDVGWVCE
jgi:hypothetical protein